MASYRRFKHKEKPWAARRKRDGVEHFLGYFSTREEAEEIEKEFDMHWSSNERIRAYS